MNLTGISTESFWGRLLRLPLDIIPARAVLPILQGRLKGKKWIVGSGVHGYWLGSYEIPMQEAIRMRVPSGNVFYDVGAHVGYYTLLAANLVGQEGKVYSFEPLARNVMYLNRHLQLNKISNVEIIEAAVSESSGNATFMEGVQHSMGRMSSDGAIQVPTVSLDELVLDGKIKNPDVIKIDVEGAEYEVLMGSQRIIREINPIIFLATHGRKIKTQCLDFLVSLGYEFYPIDVADAQVAREFLLISSP